MCDSEATNAIKIPVVGLGQMEYAFCETHRGDAKGYVSRDARCRAAEWLRAIAADPVTGGFPIAIPSKLTLGPAQTVFP